MIAASSAAGIVFKCLHVVAPSVPLYIINIGAACAGLYIGSKKEFHP
jgi:hypothetical protein